jgi:hypothetical protein
MVAWREGGEGDGGGVRSAHTKLAARKSAITRVGRSRASPPALTRLRHTACVSGCLPARVSKRSQTASAVHTHLEQELIGRRHAHATARRRVSVPMVLGESRASETGIGAMSLASRAQSASDAQRRKSLDAQPHAKTKQPHDVHQGLQHGRRSTCAGPRPAGWIHKRAAPRRQHVAADRGVQAKKGQRAVCASTCSGANAARRWRVARREQRTRREPVLWLHKLAARDAQAPAA